MDAREGQNEVSRRPPALPCRPLTAPPGRGVPPAADNYIPRPFLATILSHESPSDRPSDPEPKQLFDAALLGSLAATTRLLEAGVHPNAYRDPFGATALLVAARGGHRRLCAALLQAGAEVDATDATGETPLAAAVRKVRPEVVRLLLEHAADRSRADRWDRLPLASVLVGPQSNPAEQSIAALLGARSAEAKQRLTAEAETARAAARAAEHERLVAEAEAAAAEHASVAGARSEEARRAVEARRLCRPHAWVPNAEAAPGGRREAHPAEWAYPADAEARAAAAEAAAAAAAEAAAAARKAAEWQGRFNPLQARARPDNAPPRHHAHWNKKRQCWEPEPPGAPAPDVRALRAEPSRVASLSGFERLVLG
jgi:hypothetical protein